ncbi:nitroreductase family protein [Paenibacillus sp. ACRRY]|uniref:nitroreductase family protein n=1 Tax=Paenibacillus sp. ACRRY TaxID=2918208 RepID=UPI001EF4724C|nr:nitroreductase family protein [Paenibacillus sp. ACRRY]MCG7385943.1 nitroreductase family protein [Paenibacillus sp. ACRRY]
MLTGVNQLGSGKKRAGSCEFSPLPVPQSVIGRLLDEADPSLYVMSSKPWRFMLFAGEGRQLYLEAVRQSYPPHLADRYGDWATYQYTEAIPAHLIVVAPTGSQEDHLLPAKAWSRRFSMLAAEQGLHAVWKMNDYQQHPVFMNLMGLTSEEQVLGVFHIGYGDQPALRDVDLSRPASELMTVYNHLV